MYPVKRPTKCNKNSPFPLPNPSYECQTCISCTEHHDSVENRQEMDEMKPSFLEEKDNMSRCSGRTRVSKEKHRFLIYRKKKKKKKSRATCNDKA